MSYDIWLTIDTGGPEPATVAEVGNYTSNVSGMWWDALGYSLSDLRGKKAADCIDPLRGAIDRMKADPVHYREMNPENGWGNYDGALRYLETMLKACESNPLALVEIWY